MATKLEIGANTPHYLLRMGGGACYTDGKPVGTALGQGIYNYVNETLEDRYPQPKQKGIKQAKTS